jgi:cytochrome c heme-lyase
VVGNIGLKIELVVRALASLKVLAFFHRNNRQSDLHHNLRLSKHTTAEMASDEDPSAAKCPVDHKARSAWLSFGSKSTPTDQPPSSPSKPKPIAPQDLPTTRTISSIPRAPLPEGSPAAPANAEHDGGTSPSGRWIYPSQAQFFAALQRKHSQSAAGARPADMATVVPLHNAVNERAWAEILRWERGRGAERCGGPRLASFAGDAGRLTPRARWNVLVRGARPPFDRHDWVVERCGAHVEYVIDFYEGRKGDGKDGGVSFYLDVRPKLNSWEGWKMRFSEWLK